RRWPDNASIFELSRLSGFFFPGILHVLESSDDRLFELALLLHHLRDVDVLDGVMRDRIKAEITARSGEGYLGHGLSEFVFVRGIAVDGFQRFVYNAGRHEPVLGIEVGSLLEFALVGSDELSVLRIVEIARVNRRANDPEGGTSESG